jgi:hypothetical protein
MGATKTATDGHLFQDVLGGKHSAGIDVAWANHLRTFRYQKLAVLFTSTHAEFLHWKPQVSYTTATTLACTKASRVASLITNRLAALGLRKAGSLAMREHSQWPLLWEQGQGPLQI